MPRDRAETQPTAAERLLAALCFVGEQTLEDAANLSGLSIDQVGLAARELAARGHAEVWSFIGDDEIVSIELTDGGRWIARPQRKV